MDYLNHILGGYISVGVNSPKEYPNKPRLSIEREKTTGMTTDEQVDQFIIAKYEGK